MLRLRLQQGRQGKLSALTLLFGLALVSSQAKAGCVDIAKRTSTAWEAYDDAEVSTARTELDAAIADLACQKRLLTQNELFELFEFNALVEIGGENEKASEVAIIRAIGVDPARTPDPNNGSQLLELHAKWLARASTISVKAAGRKAIYIDGVPVPPGSVVEIVQGEHLVQIEEGAEVFSEVMQLNEHTTFLTSGREAGAPFATEALEIAPPEPPPIQSVTTRRPTLPGKPAVWGTGLGLTAIGGGALLTGLLMEGPFADDPFDADSYGGCSKTDACWAEEREQAVRRRATTIRALYGAGYGLLGVGGAMTITGLALAPSKDGVAMNIEIALP